MGHSACHSFLWQKLPATATTPKDPTTTFCEVRSFSLDELGEASSQLILFPLLPSIANPFARSTLVRTCAKWTALHPEHLGETCHEGCLPVGPDLAKASSKSQELYKAILTLFSSGNPKSRYLMMLELSIRYGEQLLKYQNKIPNQAIPDKKRPPSISTGGTGKITSNPHS